jgi:hypothetical protein
MSNFLPHHVEKPMYDVSFVHIPTRRKYIHWYGSGSKPSAPVVKGVSVGIGQFLDDDKWWITPHDEDAEFDNVGPYDTLEAAETALLLLKE